MKYFKGIKTELTKILLEDGLEYDLCLMKIHNDGVLDLDDIVPAKFLDKDNYIDLDMLHNQIEKFVNKYDLDEVHLQYGTEAEVDWLNFKNIK